MQPYPRTMLMTLVRHLDLNADVVVNNPITTRYTILKIVYVIMLIWIVGPESLLAAFIISSEENCFGRDVYSYHFSSNAAFPSYTIKVSANATFPDITMKVVSDPNRANLIFVDDVKGADMKMCKSNQTYGAKIIKVSPYASFPDITVKLSEYASFPDYTIYIDTDRLTNEEVAALFVVIWETNRNE